MSPRLIFISLASASLFCGRSANQLARTAMIHVRLMTSAMNRTTPMMKTREMALFTALLASLRQAAAFHVRALAHHVGAVRDHEQQRDEHQVGGDRAAAVAHERQRDARERDKARDAAEDDE